MGASAEYPWWVGEKVPLFPRAGSLLPRVSRVGRYEDGTLSVSSCLPPRPFPIMTRSYDRSSYLGIVWIGYINPDPPRFQSLFFHSIALHQPSQLFWTTLVYWTLFLGSHIFGPLFSGIELDTRSYPFSGFPCAIFSVCFKTREHPGSDYHLHSFPKLVTPSPP